MPQPPNRRTTVKRGTKASTFNIRGRKSSRVFLGATNPPPEGFQKWIDDFISHSIKFEERTEEKIRALTNLVNSFSKAVWLQQKRDSQQSSQAKQTPSVRQNESLNGVTAEN